MTLRDLFGPEQPPVPVTRLAFDDRVVAPGTVFFCVPGFTRDGHDFAAVAVERGASALVVQRPLDGLGVPQVLVPDVRAAMAPAAAALNGDPTARLTTAGITGTNGKTTTAYLLRALLEAGGHRTGLLGTVASVVGGVEAPTQRTTPEAIDLQRGFAEMLEAGDTHCVMEVSSHALELGRAAVHWAVALFTNLSQDHLDFHPDMEAYFAAKRRLFEAAEGPLVINVDDAHGRRLAGEFPDAITVGLEPGAAVRATEVSFGLTGSEFTLDGVRHHAPLPGRFNVQNALGAIAAARALGVQDATIAAALPTAASAPGRLEPVDAGQDFAVLVDYAHTPDGLENVLRAARQLARAGRVITVFGAGGDRDRGKRPLMGAVAAALSDVAIVTSDNPRSEDPEAIVAEVLDGAGPDARAIVDRRAAIAAAVAGARRGDVVVIAGKGHEQGQEFAGGRKEPFDDVAVAREALVTHAHPAGARELMLAWSPQELAAAAGAELVSQPSGVAQGSPPGGVVAGGRDSPRHPGPSRATVDSRDIGPGDLFVGLPGERTDGGRFAVGALASGAWGVLVAPEHAVAASVVAPADAVVLSAPDPLAALQALATAWRRALGAQVIGITGSTGKTSTKDVLAAMLQPHRRTVATRENFNTEIGLPLTVLAAPLGTEVLVLEMAMRGRGQIAELARIAEPDVGLITNVGPVHVEMLGSVEAVAAAKAELIAGLRPGATVVLPADAPLLAPHLRADLETVRFGVGGDVTDADLAGLELPFSSAHMRLNATAALAAARAIGVEPTGELVVALSAMRGQVRRLAEGITVVEDCYNANPMSMRAALDDLQRSAPGRRVAVLGDMRELGPDAEAHHMEVGEHARAAGVELLVAVGGLAAAMGGEHAVPDAAAAAALVPGLLRAGDTVLVKGSRGVGLEAVVAALTGAGPDGRLMGEILIGGTSSLLICIFLSPKFIAFLRAREFGQQIRDEGPAGHHAKAGTPTMGGIIMFTAVSIPFLILVNYSDSRAIGVYVAMMACAALGLLDDAQKVFKRRSLGLQGRWKLIVTIAISAFLWYVATQKAGLDSTLRLRTIDATIDLGPFYPVLIYLVVAGTSNAVNLTDGLDGLAAGCAAIVLLAYLGITFIAGGQQELALLCGCLVGACIGFLWFNAFPATIFMGDTGSLGLGGAVGAIAVMTKTEELLVLLGGIFVVEALSVIIQVFSFQTFRKRVFLMAPIHHHFEIAGWSETKIILRFWIIAAVCAAIGFTLYQKSIS